MKQFVFVCLAAFMLSALTACGGNENVPSAEDTANLSIIQMSSTNVASDESQADEAQPDETADESQPDEAADKAQPDETADESQPDEAPVSEQLPEPEENKGKTLIAYFSLADIVPEGADAVTHATPSIGNTEYAAMEIQRQTGGDLFAIRTVQTYPVSHQECSAIAEEEMRTDARPELSTHVENMNVYDTIYIGFPIWWYMEPMAIRTFIEEYDLTGKTIIPFCTTLGAGIGESEENIADLASGATILKGITLRTGRQDMSEEIASWIAEIGAGN